MGIQSAVACSGNLASQLVEKNLTLSPVSNTILSELVRLIPKICYEGRYIENLSDIKSYAQDHGFVYDNLLKSSEGYNQYTILYDDFVKTISKAVNSHTSFTKNIILPIIKQYKEEVENNLKSCKNLDPAFEYEIEILYMPDILNDKYFVNSFKKYEGKKLYTPEGSSLGCLPKTKEDIIELIKTGDIETDISICKWLDRKDDNFVRDVYDTYFGKGGDLNIDNLSYFEKADIGLFIFLLANKIFNDVQETERKYNLNLYRDKVEDLKRYGAIVVNSALDKINNLTKNNTVVVELDVRNNKIKVNGHVYLDWLSKEGKPEYLLGLMVQTNNSLYEDQKVYINKYNTIDQISEIKDELLDVWNRYVNFKYAADNNKKFVYFKDNLVITFNKLMYDKFDEEKDVESKNHDYKERVKRYLDEEINKLCITDMQDIGKVAKNIICNAGFYYTSANDFLTFMENAHKVNDKLNAREAALIATVEYICVFLMDQVSVRRNIV